MAYTIYLSDYMNLPGAVDADEISKVVVTTAPVVGGTPVLKTATSAVVAAASVVNAEVVQALRLSQRLRSAQEEVNLVNFPY
jgi:uncharacterized membrane protein